MLFKKEVAIRNATTARSLHDELSALGAAMIMEALEEITLNGKPKAIEQDDQLATYAPLLTKDDGKVDWSRPANEIDRQIRALNPWPGVWANTISGKRIKILEAELVSEEFTSAPGSLVDHLGHVCCGNDTAIRLIRIQPENSKAMDAQSAVNGGHLKVDDVLQ
jgi:methionyl-tRNA formyltransferase